MAQWVEAVVAQRPGDKSLLPRTHKIAKELTLEICPLVFTGTYMHK